MILGQLDAINGTRIDLLEEVTSLPSDLVVWKPAPDRWSILEIVEHLVLAEQDVLGDLEGLDQLPLLNRELKHRLRFGLVMSVLRLRIPVKVPSRAMSPTGLRTLDELRAAWDRNHEQLRAFVAALDRDGEGRAVFRHPVTGPLTVREGIRMLGVHLETHRRQIRKLVGDGRSRGT